MEISQIHSLFYPDRLRLPKGHESDERLVSEKTVIKSGQVSIIALPGQRSRIEDYFGGRESWQFEPYPELVEIIARDNPENIKAFETSRNGKEVLWGLLQEEAGRISQEAGVEIDVEMLTPYQALNLVSEVVKSRVRYENLITPGAGQIVKDGLAIHTPRKDLLDLFVKDPKQFEIETSKYRIKIDRQKADEIIRTGYGVCNHIAASASVMYEVLKEKQKGILLNGSYFVYHGENAGSQERWEVLGTHSYNLFVVSSPNGEVSISVVDPTFMLSDGKMDYTWRRLSQACSFLQEYGVIFTEKKDGIVEDLANQAVDRLEKYIFISKTPIYYQGKDKLSLIGLLPDYVSLVDQGTVGKSGRTLEYSTRFLGNFGFSREEALFEALRTAAYSNKEDEKYVVKKYRLGEVNRELRKVDFSGQVKMDLALLGVILENRVGFCNPKYFNNLDKVFTKISDQDRDFLELMGHYARYCVCQGEAPESKEVVVMMEIAFRLAKKAKLDYEILQKWERDFFQLPLHDAN